MWLAKIQGPALLGVAAIALVAGLATAPTEAHKPITSKYTYNEHVFPILRDHCGACHVEGGVAPMSLLTYRDARPWVESIREELIAERMPPHYVAGAGAGAIIINTGITGGNRPLTARELDTIIVWATGGTPEGDVTKRPASVPPRPDWPGGRPDLVVRMPSPVTLAAGRAEDTRELVIATGLTESRFVRAVDLLPGTPSMVRDATVAVENGPVLAVWVTGDSSISLAGPPAGTAFRLDAGARLRLRIHYKKSWRDGQRALSDRTSVGLYFTDAAAPGRTIRSVAVESAAPAPGRIIRSVAVESSGRVVTDPMQVLAVRPQLDRPYGSVEIDARTPAGLRVPLLRLRAPRPEWPRRYWLRQPVDLPAGTRLEITTVPASLDAGQPTQPTRGALTIALDVVSP